MLYLHVHKYVVSFRFKYSCPLIRGLHNCMNFGILYEIAPLAMTGWILFTDWGRYRDIENLFTSAVNCMALRMTLSHIVLPTRSYV